MLYALGDTKPQVQTDCWIAPNATVIGSVILEPEVGIWWNAVLRGDNDVIRIGARSNVQDGAVLHTDPGIALSVGAGVTVGHQVMLHGCSIGENSLIGIKAVILNHAVIGKNCLIGANSLVTEGKVIADGSLVVGSPAKVVRALTEAEIARLAQSATHYVEKLRRYRATLAKLP